MVSRFNSVRIIGVILVSCHLLSLIFPEQSWGFHYLSFLPLGWKSVLVTVSLSLIILPSLWQRMTAFFRSAVASNRHAILGLSVMLIMVTCTGIYMMPIALDEYGNAYQYTPYEDQTVHDLPDQVLDELLSFSLAPSTGRRTVLNLYTLISYYLQVDYGLIFKWMGILSAIGFLITWLLMVFRFLKVNTWRLVMVILGVFAPFTQVFYNHSEIYAPVYFLVMLWLFLFLIQLENRSGKLLLLLLLLLLLMIKAHPLNIILAIPWFLVFLKQSLAPVAKVDRLFSWKALLLALVIPIFSIGLLVYFFILKDHNDPMILDVATDAERLFLPIFAPPPPLDKYTLFSWNHLLDCANAICLWSLPAVFICVSIVGLTDDRTDLYELPARILGTTLLLFVGALFMINPLLSMPMDWDLFSFPSTLVLTLSLLLVRKVEEKKLPSFIIPTILSLQLLSMPIFVVNSNLEMLSYRLETVGRHVYKTHYQHSSRIIIRSLGMIEDMDLYLARKQIILDELRPISAPGNDPMYANLLMDDGYYFLRFAHDYARAERRLSQALYYDPHSTETLALLTEAKEKFKAQLYTN